ncbi:hypothetical protein IC608_12250 [Devosia sp. PTR5]|uniref:DUF2946 domain-containing protein n=1 Tax=Devosia oryzisoli TaxID=2774138 RepID=A0A927IU07_9HYPH|nr:hypothetical protein [Devosia oryzisoli]MBD8066241.1 hypothetical protein [Devosia oryzisoli]
MSTQVRRMVKEAGTAFAVLALYVLTLLLPLHQAAGLQRDLDAAGYAPLTSWSICAPLSQDRQGEPHREPAVHCPAAGIAKHQFAAILPPPPAPALIPRTAAVAHAAAPGLNQFHLPDHFGQSRAPPARA